LGAKRAEILHLDLDKNLIDIVYDPSIPDVLNDQLVTSPHPSQLGRTKGKKAVPNWDMREESGCGSKSRKGSLDGETSKDSGSDYEGEDSD